MAHVLTTELRYAVMQAAFEGKVVQQNALDTPIFKTLSVIKNVKNELIQNKIIKRFKTSPIKKEETLDVPDNWFISRLNDVIDVRDGTHDSPKYQSTGIPFITSKNLVNGTIDFTNVKYISKEDADNFNKRSKVSNGDILMAMIGSIGKPVLVQNIDTEFAIKNVALFKKYEGTDINMAYVYLYLKYAEMKMNNESTGGVQKFVSLSYLRNYIIPLPPIEEQARIVAKVDEIMAKIDEYEKLENQLVKLKEQFPQDMKDSLLQAGMMGKLTEQLETDIPVEETLKEITEKKAQLVKNKSIRKEKLLPKINEDEVLFDIPSTWKWVRLSSLYLILNGDRGKNYPSKNKLHKTGNYPFISALNLENNRVKKDDNLLYLNNEQYESLKAGKLVNNDRVMCIRGSLGKHGVFSGVSGAIASSLVIIRKVLPSENADFIDLFLDSPVIFQQINSYNNGTALPNLSAKNLKQFIVPVPPIEEQQRIVDKLDKLLPLVDKLAELN